MKVLAGVLISMSLFLVLPGCAGSDAPAQYSQRQVAARPGSTPVALEFVMSHENVARENYFPLEGLAGCAYTSDGSLIICDEKRGKVYGLDSGTGRWYEFDTPMVRPYRPVAVAVDGFKILVLDAGGNTVQRFDLSGALQDQLLDLRQVDPGTISQVAAFDMDRDGRMVITDQSSHQVLLLDAFLNLSSRLGESGIQDDQFSTPDGIVFLPDGRIVVADTGNSRLSLYGRMGFFEQAVGGRFDPNNPFMAPSGVDADRYGNVFVADLVGGQIHVIGAHFRHLFSSGHNMVPAGLPEAPIGIAVSPDGYLAVTDRARQAVLIYRIIYE